jgi:hypothetical protein
MKAETILKLIERALNPDLKQAHIKAYAQAMIEKDRERVFESVVREDYFINEHDLEIIYMETPIILD